MQTSHFIAYLLLVCLLFSCNTQVKEVQKKAPSIGQIASSLDAKTWKVFQDKKGNYWFGSNGNGVYIYDGKKLKQVTQKDGLIDDSIREIKEDHLGNIYIGTPEGISKYDGTTFTTLTPIISASNTWKLTQNDLWFNCNGNANELYRYDGDSLFELALPRMNLNEAFGTEVQGLGFKGMNSSPYSVFGIDKDKKGNLWIGTVVAGAFRYDGDSFLWIPEMELTTLPDGRVPGVRSMLEDKDGFMWLSNFISKYKINDTNTGYEKLDGIADQVATFQDRLPYFNSGLSDKDGNLWMTTYTGGVWKYDGKTLQNFAVYDGETEALIVSIYEDNKGILWLGTDNTGVYKFNGTAFEPFDVAVE